MELRDHARDVEAELVVVRHLVGGQKRGLVLRRLGRLPRYYPAAAWACARETRAGRFDVVVVDPPALATSTPVPATPTPAAPTAVGATPTTKPAGTVRPGSRTPTRAPAATGAGGGLLTASPGEVPVGGGRPPGVDRGDETMAIAAGITLLVAGTFVSAASLRRAKPRD